MKVMSAFLNNVSPSRVISIVLEIARYSTDRYLADRDDYWAITPEDVRILATARPTCAGMMVVLSGHRNGYIREAAVVGLEGLTVACVLPALRDRLNDWVGPVRRAAHRALRGFLSSDYAATLVGSLDLLESLQRRGRADRGLAESLCIRSLGLELNPFLHPDPWQVWAEQHGHAWSPEHRERVRELMRRTARGRP